MLRPSDLPSSGSLRGPKMISAITKMTISSGMPMEPNIKTTPWNEDGTDERRRMPGPLDARPRELGEASVYCHYGTVAGQGQALVRGQKWLRKSLLVLGLSASIEIMPRSRFFPSAHSPSRFRPIAGGVFGRSVGASEDRLTEHYRTFTAALAADRVALRRQGQVRPAGLRLDLRDAADARSAFELHGSAAVRPAARAPGRALLRPGHHHPGDRRRHHGDGHRSKARRPTRRASDAATSSPRSTARTPRAGPAIRRSASCAVRRARTSRSRSSAPAATQLIPISTCRATRSRFPRSAPPSWSTSKTGYVRLQDFAENTDRDLGRALDDLTDKGMKRLLLDIRDNPGGPLDQAIRVSNRFLPRGRHDRLHARPRARIPIRIIHATEDERLRHAAAGRPGQPQLRQRVGDRLGCAAGSRSRAHRRRDDVRQGAGAVDLSRQPGRRPRADDGALLHAQRPPDSAAVGRHLRRVPVIYAARPGCRTGRTIRRT